MLYFKTFLKKGLNKHASLKENYGRSNHESLLMNKQLCKVILTKSQLLNKYRKSNNLLKYLIKNKLLRHINEEN